MCTFYNDNPLASALCSKVREEDVAWNHLVQDKGQLWALVNSAMNLGDSQNTGNFLSS